MKELVKPDFFQNTFILLYSIAAFFLVLNKLWYNKRLSLNISKPNVYIFEFESQSAYFLTAYNLNAILFKILSYTLYNVTILKIARNYLNISFQNRIDWQILVLATTGYFILKFILETLYVFLIKQSNFLNKIRFIRTTYEFYTFFYLFFVGFLVYYFPFQSRVFFYLIITISVIWIAGVWANIYVSLRKHTEFKTYQIILYLCLSEILPFILLNGWIIFQIL